MSKEMIWFAPTRAQTIGSNILQDNQFTLSTIEIDHPISGDPVRSTIVGGQVWFNLYSTVDLEQPPELFLCRMDSHMATTPPLVTDSDKAENGEWVWMHALSQRPGSGARIFLWNFKLTTKRKMDYNDKLAFVVINRDTTTIPLASRYTMVLDLYLLLDV